MSNLEIGESILIDDKDRLRLSLRKCIADYKISNSAQGAAEIASYLLALGKHSFAKTWALEAIGMADGNCDRARLILGNIGCLQNDYISAWHEYKKLIRGDEGVEALKHMAGICSITKKPLYLQWIVDILEKNHPLSAEAQLFVANHYLKLGDTRNAWLSVRRAVSVSPSNKPAWELAYECALKMKEHATAVQIAKKLVLIAPSDPKCHDLLGKAYHLNCQPSECRESYAQASRLAPRNLIYFLNAHNQVRRIAKSGNNAFRIASSLASSAEMITENINKEVFWSIYGSDSLLPFAFHAAYSPLNLKHVFEPYLCSLSKAFAPLLKSETEKSGMAIMELSQKLPLKKRKTPSPNGFIKKIRVGFLSRNFYAHSNTHAFIGYFVFLDRARFEIVVIHRHETTVDADHLYINSLADEVVYLDPSLSATHTVLSRLELDILFFTDIGMDPFDFLIPNMRTCPIQVSGWGLPHTTGLKSIDYYLSSSWLEHKEMQSEYTENLVLLEGFPCCFPRDLLYFRKTSRDYFLLPDDSLIIGCVQSLSKVHPDMDIIIEALARQLPDAIFAFMCSTDYALDVEFMKRLNLRAPTASKRLLLMNRCATKDYLALCNNFDIMLDTPYYGAGITAYLSTYVGTPTVCFRGSRLRDSTVAAIYQYLEITDPPVANSIGDYINKAMLLCSDADKRNAIKKQLIDKAHRIYDDQTYIRSFEAFCIDTVGFS